MIKQNGDIRIFAIKDLHESLGMSEQTLTYWFDIGKLKGIKIGKEWHISEVDLKAFFNIKHVVTREEFKAAVSEIENALRGNEPISKQANAALKVLSREIKMKNALLRLFKENSRLFKKEDSVDYQLSKIMVDDLGIIDKTLRSRKKDKSTEG
jgi:hypothetical protein